MHETEATMTTSRRMNSALVAAVAQSIDVVIDRCVLLHVEIRLRNVRLGLVVVVVRDEVLDGRIPGRNSRNSLHSCAASVLLCAITSAGRSSFSITQAMVAVLPVPVAPSSVVQRSPRSTASATSPIARG